jgi:hypothetical protein
MPEKTTPALPAALHQYLARHRFAPHPGNSAWLDHDTGQQIIRICHDPGEATSLYCLTASAVCLCESVFSPGTPAPVIIAAVRTALRAPPIQTG